MANNTVLITKEAAEVSGFSARHIQKLIKTGKLSATKVNSGNYIIDKSEFYRVFPDAHVANTTRMDTNKDDSSSRTALELQMKHLQEINGLLTTQLETANKEKGLLLDTLASTQRLLEHDSSKRMRKRLFGIF